MIICKGYILRPFVNQEKIPKIRDWKGVIKCEIETKQSSS